MLGGPRKCKAGVAQKSHRTRIALPHAVAAKCGGYQRTGGDDGIAPDPHAGDPSDVGDREGGAACKEFAATITTQCDVAGSVPGDEHQAPAILGKERYL